MRVFACARVKGPWAHLFACAHLCAGVCKDWRAESMSATLAIPEWVSLRFPVFQFVWGLLDSKQLSFSDLSAWHADSWFAVRGTFWRRTWAGFVRAAGRASAHVPGCFLDSALQEYRGPSEGREGDRHALGQNGRELS